MRSNIQVFLLSTLIFLGCSFTAFAQLSNWTYKTPVTITENRGESGTNYVMFVDINTAQHVSAGRMLANGNDIRFATDCNGTQLIPYWIESGMNTTSTRIWLRLPVLTANSANEVYLFMGNPSAPAGSSQASVFVNNLIVNTNTTLPVGNYHYDWFEVQSGVTLTLTGNNADIFRVNAGKIVVDGVLNGNSAGYNGGIGANNGSGPGGGVTSQLGGGTGTGASGGGYGGNGGNGGYDVGETLPAGGASYGVAGGLTIEPGSGGGGTPDPSSSNNFGGNGGAGIHLEAFDLVFNNAMIFTNGGSAPAIGVSGWGTGGGAGGGVLLTGERITINNTDINANGGNGGTGSGADDGGGGGGGGRIKLAYYNSAITTLAGLNTSILGGTGGCCGNQAPGENGINGTVFTNNPAGAFTVSSGSVSAISPPIAIIAGEDTVCRNSSGQTLETYQANTAPGFNYTWQVLTGGNIVSGQGTSAIMVNWTANGNHKVIVSDNSGACIISDTLPVSVSTAPVANFTFTSPTCPSGAVTFTNTSTNATSYIWNFGDGGSTSTATNPTHSYAAAGTYPVALSATTNNCTSTITKSVTISPNPFPNFTISGDTLACTNQNEIYSTNIGGGNTITWVLSGGGSILNGQGTNAVEVDWATPGSYFVKVTASSGAGCTTSDSLQVDVDNVVNVAVPTFTQACAGEVTQFTANAPGTGGPYTFFWNFGDGATSTFANPTHAYTVAGIYTVTLTAISTPNCNAVTTRSVTVSPRPTVNFAATSACPDSLVTFTNLSTVASGTNTNYLWNFGDGNTSNLVNPTHAYVAAGTYQVKLTATTNMGCIDSLTRSVTVYARPVANFTATTTVCDGTTVTFTNSSTVSTGTLSYAWRFGDGGTSTDINPTHLYPSAGTYNVTLTATSDNGCVNTITKPVMINATPVASFTASATTICLGDTIRFVNTSTTGATIQYAWDFGDGNFAFVQDTAYVYTTTGTFKVVLGVFNAVTSCFDTASAIIVVNQEPTARFNYTDVCRGTATAFTNLSTIPVGTLSYNWNFGDGSSSTDINPTHLYATMGTFNVLLTVISNNGCIDTLTQAVTVFPEPLASFTINNPTACDNDTVVITNTSVVSGINNVYTWSFGDGNTSNDVNPSYVYGGPGTYTIILTINDTLTGCNDADTAMVTIFHRPVAAFTTADVCLGATASFTNGSTIGVGTMSYFWDFGDTTFSTNINPTHIYTSIGIKTIILIVTSNNGCTDTVTHTLIVNPQPDADFSVGPTCFGNPTDFTNLTTIAFGSNTYLWNFGDGTTSTDSNATHTYTVLGNYTITLTATSNAGCTDVSSQVITVHPNPTANFNRANVCEDEAVVFENTSTTPYGTLTSFWDFGDGFTSVDRNPTYTYTGFGPFNVTLISTTNNGCADTITKPITIYPKPAIQFDVEDVCIGDTVAFDNISTVPNGGTISDVRWFFGDGQVSLEVSPRHYYASPGIYQPYLVVTTTQGCTDTLRKTVVVHDLPPATIQALGPLAFCDGGSVELRAPSGQAGYLWSTGETTQSITVTTSGTYSLTVTSTFSCTNSSSIVVTVYALPNVSAGNDTTISKGYTAMLHGSGGIAYSWTPTETLSNANIANPTARPLETTTYTLVAIDIHGCQGTDDVTVFVNQDFLVEATNTLTPNDDGKNDVWYIYNIETYPEVEVLIFDRWGTEVYQSKAYQNDWGGTYKDNKLPEGTYYYVIRFDGSDRLYKGAVNILR